MTDYNNRGATKMRVVKKHLSKAKIRFHSGYKNQETPTSITIGNKEYKIDEILYRKRIRDQASGNISEVFKCRAHQKDFLIEVSEDGISRVVSMENHSKKDLIT
jgi:hypothetical protein